MTFGTGSSIREQEERYSTTKDNLFWAIDKGFINIFLTQQGDMFFGHDTEDGPYVFGKLPASQFLIQLFGFSGGFHVNAEELSFLGNIAIKNGYDSDGFDEYSLLSKENET